MLTEQNEEKCMYLTIIIILMYMYTVNMPYTCFSCMWEIEVIHIYTSLHNKTT